MEAIAPRITSHMMTSPPSQPPRRAYSAAVISVSFSGSFSKRSMNSMSHRVLLKSGALAMNLMRKAAGGDDGDLNVFRILVIAFRRDLPSL